MASEEAAASSSSAAVPDSTPTTTAPAAPAEEPAQGSTPAETPAEVSADAPAPAPAPVKKTVRKVAAKNYSTDPALYIYTSLTAGNRHIITATSRLETILRANRVPFKAIDVATDEKARMLWGRRAGKAADGRPRRLPGLVQTGLVLGVSLVSSVQVTPVGWLANAEFPRPRTSSRSRSGTSTAS